LGKSLTFTLSCTGANGNPAQTATLGVGTGPNGCTVVPEVLKRADRQVSRRRKASARTSGM
jgi:hypothetical protein